MSQTIRIGTRDSELALWQAKTVQKKLEDLGFSTTLIPVKSTGDLVLDKPLYELGITGIFTKTLDVAMLKGDIDIAVHSMKDVPTQLPQGIVQAAVLKRADVNDIFVQKEFIPLQELKDQRVTIATGSLRRKAQWLHTFPNHNVVDLRGNVNTRLQKVNDNDWAGAIFAQAGLERINLTPEKYTVLDWMIPAPAQGAMVITSLEKDFAIRDACAKLNDHKSEIATTIEREFLRTLEGGCTAPIGALATIQEQKIHFYGAVFSLDGKEKLEIKKSVDLNKNHKLGESCANEILNQGGDELMQRIKKSL